MSSSTTQPRNFPTSGTRSRLPALIEGATWQAGITRGNEKLRPFVDGEPAPLCFAANPDEGWAMVYCADCGRDRLARDDAGNALARRRYGRVTLLPTAGE